MLRRGFAYSLGSGESFDSDASAFIAAATITDDTQKAAINQLVLDFKSAGVWSKMKAVYPMVGGTASKHKWNLKDPRDLDAAYRLTFVDTSGSFPIHSSNGVTWNLGKANTFLIPSSNLTANNTHLSYYSMSNVATGIDMGAQDEGNNRSLFLLIKYNADNNIYTDQYNQSAGRISGSNTNRADGLWLSSRSSSTNFIVQRQGVKVFQKLTAVGGSLPIVPLFLGIGNLTGLNSTRPCSFASIGDGLTESEGTAFYNAVQSYQTALGRAITL